MIAILVAGLYMIGLFTGSIPVVITGLVISSVCFVFCLFLCIEAPIAANIDKEAFEKGFGEKFDKQAEKKVKKSVRNWGIIYVILTLGNILLLIL